MWNALKTIPRLLEDLKFRKGIVLKSFHSNVYLVLSLPVCKIAVCIYRTHVPPHGAILMLRKSALTIANRLPNDNRQVTNSSPTVDRPSVNSSTWENCQPTVGRLSANCCPFVDRLLVVCWPTAGRQPTDLLGSSSSIYPVLTRTSKCLIGRKQWVNSDLEKTANFDL